MTKEQLKRYADMTLELAAAELRETGSIEMFAILVLPDGSLSVVQLPGAQANSNRAKDAFATFVRKAIREQRAEAVVLVADSWLAAARDEEAGRKITRLNLNTAQAEAPGTRNAQGGPHCQRGIEKRPAHPPLTDVSAPGRRQRGRARRAGRYVRRARRGPADVALLRPRAGGARAMNDRPHRRPVAGRGWYHHDIAHMI